MMFILKAILFILHITPWVIIFAIPMAGIYFLVKWIKLMIKNPVAGIVALLGVLATAIAIAIFIAVVGGVLIVLAGIAGLSASSTNAVERTNFNNAIHFHRF